jgi:predicted esterase
MAAILPKFITVPSATKHTATVIFLHGLGDTGNGWKPVADMLQKDSGVSHVKWVLPHAPIKKVTANMGMQMPAWFDIHSFDSFQTTEDEAGMMVSVDSIKLLIKAEIDSGIDPSRIVLGGFSQGACMSLLAGLTSEKKLAGVVALSGWLPLKDKFKSMAAPHAASVPIFWGHGASDPLVKLKYGQLSTDFLVNQLGVPRVTPPEIKGLQWNVYNGLDHSTNMKELDDLKAWIKKVLPKEEVQA